MQVKLLVNSGSDINALTVDKKRSPITAALRYPEILEYLIASGADVNIKLSQRKTPLHYALESPHYYASHYAGMYEAACILLKNGADVNAKDLYGKTPLHLGIVNKEIATILLDYGANLHAVEDVGCKPLHYAYVQCDIDLIKALIEKGAPLDDLTRYGNALHYACGYRTYDKFKKLELIKFLIEEQNMNINQHGTWHEGKDGAFTPIMRALETQNP